MLNTNNWTNQFALVYKLYRCQMFTTSQLKRPMLGSKQRAKGIPKGSLVWRTGLSGAGHVRCNCGATAISAPTATCSALNARQRAQKSGTPMLAHRTLYSTCLVRHRTSRRAQKTVLQRSEPNGFGDVAGAPDCPMHHTTVSPTKRLVWWLGL